MTLLLLLLILFSLRPLISLRTLLVLSQIGSHVTVSMIWPIENLDVWYLYHLILGLTVTM